MVTGNGPAGEPLEAAADYETFRRIDMRIGRIISARPLEGAHRPAYKMEIDFGPLGTRRSSARLTDFYAADELVGRHIIAVVNFPARRIAGFKSEVLVLGVDSPHGVILLEPDPGGEAIPGMRVY